MQAGVRGVPVPGSEALASFIPEIREEIVDPLLAAGHSVQAIRDLGGVDGLIF